MMNKKLITGVSIVATGVIVVFGVKAAMSSNNSSNDTLQVDRKHVTTTMTTAVSSIPETTTTRTGTNIETTTTTKTTTAVSEETTTVTTTLPKEIIPEVTTTVPMITNSEVTSTTVITTTEIPTNTTEINTENIEGITTLSYDDVKNFVIANFDDYPENYEITVKNGIFYLNEYVVVFTNMQNIGELKETSLGMGIVVSSWARTGYVIVMENVTG